MDLVTAPEIAQKFFSDNAGASKTTENTLVDTVMAKKQSNLISRLLKCLFPHDPPSQPTVNRLCITVMSKY